MNRSGILSKKMKKAIVDVGIPINIAFFFVEQCKYSDESLASVFTRPDWKNCSFETAFEFLKETMWSEKALQGLQSLSSWEQEDSIENIILLTKDYIKSSESLADIVIRHPGWKIFSVRELINYALCTQDESGSYNLSVLAAVVHHPEYQNLDIEEVFDFFNETGEEIVDKSILTHPSWQSLSFEQQCEFLETRVESFPPSVMASLIKETPSLGKLFHFITDMRFEPDDEIHLAISQREDWNKYNIFDLLDLGRKSDWRIVSLIMLHPKCSEDTLPLLIQEVGLRPDVLEKIFEQN